MDEYSRATLDAINKVMTYCHSDWVQLNLITHAVLALQAFRRAQGNLDRTLGKIENEAKK